MWKCAAPDCGHVNEGDANFCAQCKSEKPDVPQRESEPVEVPPERTPEPTAATPAPTAKPAPESSAPLPTLIEPEPPKRPRDPVTPGLRKNQPVYSPKDKAWEPIHKAQAQPPLDLAHHPDVEFDTKLVEQGLHKSPHSGYVEPPPRRDDPVAVPPVVSPPTSETTAPSNPERTPGKGGPATLPLETPGGAGSSSLFGNLRQRRPQTPEPRAAADHPSSLFHGLKPRNIPPRRQEAIAMPLVAERMRPPVIAPPPRETAPKPQEPPGGTLWPSPQPGRFSPTLIGPQPLRSEPVRSPLVVPPSRQGHVGPEMESDVEDANSYVDPVDAFTEYGGKGRRLYNGPVRQPSRRHGRTATAGPSGPSPSASSGGEDTMGDVIKEFREAIKEFRDAIAEMRGSGKSSGGFQKSIGINNIFGSMGSRHSSGAMAQISAALAGLQ